MKTTLTSAAITYILLLVIAFSALPAAAQQTATYKMEREPVFLELCKKLNIPLSNADVIFMPPTMCRSCQKGFLLTLDQYPNVYVLHEKLDSCSVKKSTQKCIGYLRTEVEKKGLIKMYSALIKIRNGKVVEYAALFK